MGFIQFVKSAICRLRAAGKEESEIAGILEDAAEKSTVNREAIKEREPETALEPRHNQNDSLDSINYALMAAGIAAKEAMTALETRMKAAAEITAKEAMTALETMKKAARGKPKHETNNWRKMHGLPMKRKRKEGVKVWKRKKNRQPCK